MVKSIILMLFFSTILQFSCSNYNNNLKNKCGMDRVKYKLNNVHSVYFKKCDTTSVYRFDGEFTRNENNEIYFSKKNLNNYYKFYGDGKVGFFGLEKNEILTKEKLNPCYFLNAYYGIDNKQKIVIKRYARTKSNGSFTIKNYIYFKGDTLEVYEEDSYKRGYKKIFLKNKIPKDWLIYKPDW